MFSSKLIQWILFTVFTILVCSTDDIEKVNNLPIVSFQQSQYCACWFFKRRFPVHIVKIILAYSKFTPFTTELCVHRRQVAVGALSRSRQWFVSIPEKSDGEIWWPYTVNLSDLTTGKRVRIFRHNNVMVSTCAISDNELFVMVGSAEGDIFLWNTRSADLATTLTGHTNFITSCRFFLADTRILSGSEDQTVRIWTTTGICIHVLNAGAGVQNTAVSKNNLFIASTSFQLKIWGSVTGNNYFTLFDHEHSMSEGSCIFSTDSKLFGFMSYDGKTRVWKLRTGLRSTGDCYVTRYLGSEYSTDANYHIYYLTNDHIFYGSELELGLFNFRKGTSIYKFFPPEGVDVFPIRFVDVFGGGKFIMTVSGEDNKHPIVQIRRFDSGDLIK